MAVATKIRHADKLGGLGKALRQLAQKLKQRKGSKQTTSRTGKWLEQKLEKPENRSIEKGVVGENVASDGPGKGEYDALTNKLALNRQVLEVANARPIHIKGTVDEIDLELLRIDGQSIIDNPFLSRVSSQLDRYDIPVRYDYDAVLHRDFGETTKYLDGGIEIDIFKQNAFTTKDSFDTYVHESSHGMAAARGREIGTLADEYQAFRRKLLFKKGRRPSIEERRTLFNYVQDEYHDVNKGNVAPFFPRLS